MQRSFWFSSFVLVLAASAFSAEDVAVLRAQGIQALNDSRANTQRIVDAAKLFAKAQELYSAAGNDEKAVEMNSFLFWCKKKMTIEDAAALAQSGGAVAEKLNAVEKLAPKPDEAKAWFERAEKFARENPSEHFLIAVRFNEVAARFKGHDLSFAALDRSLKENELSLATATPAPAAPAPQPAAAEPPKPAAAPKPGDLQGDKTLVAFVRPDKLTSRGGGVFSITEPQEHFEAILFGVHDPARWTPGSEFNTRTLKQYKDFPRETALAEVGVVIAIAYRGHEISMFRNGQKVIQYKADVDSPSFGSDAYVLFGQRHTTNTDRFSGSIFDARIYDRALTDDQIARLRFNAASDVKPWAWWTFEDNKGRERMGRFAPLKLLDGAEIQNGRLILDGVRAAASAQRQ